MPALPDIWFGIVAALLIGYAVLDGFDLGAGAVHLIVARTDTERSHVLNSIGPVWDGNEVWLITGGAALFAAFPIAYATIFSGFYLAMVLVLAALILRAAAIEYRGKETGRWWRRIWDFAFFFGSALAALLFGVALGNLIHGVPLDFAGASNPRGIGMVQTFGVDMEVVYNGGLVGMLNPFGLLTGLLTLALAVQQGSAWLVLKTEGPMAERARRSQLVAMVVVVALWLILSAMAWTEASTAAANFKSNPAAWLGPILTLNAFFFGFRAWHLRQAFRSFGCSSLVVIGLGLTAVAALYPKLVPALEPMRSLTVQYTHSSETSLTVMLVVAAIGMPIVLAYTAFIYWKFKGKVELDEASY